MTGDLEALGARRRLLQRRAEEQRQQLADCVGAIETQCSGVDRGFLRAQGLLRKPVVLAGGAALLLFLGPGRLMSLAGRAAVLISLARRLLRRGAGS